MPNSPVFHRCLAGAGAGGGVVGVTSYIWDNMDVRAK